MTLQCPFFESEYNNIYFLGQSRAEWTRMLFTPFRPFMVGTWVPGKLVAPGVVEFERKRIWWDGKKYPDVLVFDKNYELKHALDGNPAESVENLAMCTPGAAHTSPKLTL